MKPSKLTKYLSLGLTAAALGTAGVSHAQDVLITNVFQTFDADASGTGEEWGSGTVAWDGTMGNPAGALLVTLNFNSSSDTPAVAYVCLDGGNPWYQPQTVAASAYQYLEFDILYDPTSDVSIAQFNDLSTWDTTLTNSAGQYIMQSWAGSGYLAGSTAGFDIEYCGGPAGQLGPVIVATNIPAAAASGWVHMKIPLNQAEAQIDGVNGIVFHKWINQNWGIQNQATVRLWIDNVVLTGTAAPPPPPTVSPLVKAAPGLNVFASTANSPYDRQSAALRQTSGLTWVGQATAANPVTYSFTISGYPNSGNCEAWMYLVPNPAYLDNAPDWNETNVGLFYLQGNSSSATAHFQYKVNEDHQQAMYSGGSETRTTGTTTNNYYYTAAPGSLPGGPVITTLSPGVYNVTNESGNLIQVTNLTGVLGTWTLQFTSDTNVTVITPDGHSASAILPAINAGYFAEQVSPGFYVYLGMQANNPDAYNQSVAYSSFGVTGTASPYSENFLTDAFLDTTNIWNTSAASGPQGVLLVPTNALYWAKWTLPDGGFSLQTSPTLGTPLTWTSPSAGPVVALNGMRAQAVSTSEVPAGNSAFFELIQRTFTQLQVLFPGETNAPNTATGKTGAPLTTFTSSDLIPVTINAVDSTFHIVSSGDALSLGSSDSGAIFVNGTPALSGGTTTAQVYFDTGSFTVTATDTTSTNIPPATSSSISIQ